MRCKRVCFLLISVVIPTSRFPQKNTIIFRPRPFTMQQVVTKLMSDSKCLAQGKFIFIHKNSIFLTIIKSRYIIMLTGELHKMD